MDAEDDAQKDSNEVDYSHFYCDMELPSRNR